MNTQALNTKTILVECYWGGNRSSDPELVTDGRIIAKRGDFGAVLDGIGTLSRLDAGVAARTWTAVVEAERVEVEEFYIDPDGQWTPTVEMHASTASVRMLSKFSAHLLSMILSVCEADTFALIRLPNANGSDVPALLGLLHGAPVWALMGIAEDGR